MTTPPTPTDALLPFIKTTGKMRARLRELSDTTGKDDYDRCVLMLLDDFAQLMAHVAPLADAYRRAALSPKPCTCHPDEAPKPCPRKYALTECRAARITPDPRPNWDNDRNPMLKPKLGADDEALILDHGLAMANYTRLGIDANYATVERTREALRRRIAALRAEHDMWKSESAAQGAVLTSGVVVPTPEYVALIARAKAAERELAACRDKVIEECAACAEDFDVRPTGSYATRTYIATAIRALKTKEPTNG